MIMLQYLKNFSKREFPKFGGLDIIKFIGPGLLVTVGFIDPGNWASNLAAGSQFGYRLLWIVTLSTVMLIFLQHNAAHLGIATGLCLSEAAAGHFRPVIGRPFLASAIGASISTALAEILGAAIGINMLTGLPIALGAPLTAAATLYLLLSNNYRRIEKYIIACVSIIGISYIYELSLISVPWREAARAWIVPSFPAGSLPIIMSVLGAVVMPHNIYLHSEIIQSRQWNRESDDAIRRQLKYEIADTIFAMLVGWAINSAMIIVAASTFHAHGTIVADIPQAGITLRPLLGGAASTVFAIALIFSGFSSSMTAAMAGGSIFAGLFHEPFNVTDRHSRLGIIITITGGLVILFFLSDPFQGLIWSQIALSIQLPWTIIGQIALTSSKKVMGKYRNTLFDTILLATIAVIVTLLNIFLLLDMLDIFKI